MDSKSNLPSGVGKTSFQLVEEKYRKEYNEIKAIKRISRKFPSTFL